MHGVFVAFHECAVQTQMIYLSILGKLEKPTNDDAAYLSP